MCMYRICHMHYDTAQVMNCLPKTEYFTYTYSMYFREIAIIQQIFTDTDKLPF